MVGVAYKPGVEDVRESPALEIIGRLIDAGARVSFTDPLVAAVRVGAVEIEAVPDPLDATWDLVIVDKAHKMSAPGEDRKTYAYRLGESLSRMTDHYLLMTATPHKGDQDHFRRFLALLEPYRELAVELEQPDPLGELTVRRLEGRGGGTNA